MKAYPRLVTLYGWDEQNEVAGGVHIRHQPENEIDDLSDDEVSVTASVGRWFRSFSAAKRACLSHWKKQRQIAVDAISDIRKAKKQSIPKA